MRKVILLLICVLMVFSGCALSRQQAPDHIQSGSGGSADEPDNPSDSSPSDKQDDKKPDPESADDGMNSTTWQPDPSQSVEIQLGSGKARTISIPCGDNASLDISFVEGSVIGDTVFEVTPLTSEGYPGFILEEKGAGGHVLVDYPASICYMTTEKYLMTCESSSWMKTAD